MILGPPVKHFASPDAVIDIHNPDFYCAKCDKYYKKSNLFRNHLRRVHSMGKAFVNPNAKIDTQSPDFYCKKCDKYFSSKDSFDYHLMYVHKLS